MKSSNRSKIATVANLQEAKKKQTEAPRVLKGPRREPPPLKVIVDQVVHNSLATALPEILDALDDKDLDRLDRAIDRQLRLIKQDKP